MSVTVTKTYTIVRDDGGWRLVEQPSGRWVVHSSVKWYFKRRMTELGIPFSDSPPEPAPEPTPEPAPVSESPPEPTTVSPITDETPSSYGWYHKRYYQLNKEKILAYAKDYAKDHKEEVRARQRAYYHKRKAAKFAAKLAAEEGKS